MSTPMYVLVAGRDYEGGASVGVYTSMELAKADIPGNFTPDKENYTGGGVWFSNKEGEYYRIMSFLLDRPSI